MHNTIAMYSGGDRLKEIMGSARINNPAEFTSIINDLRASGVTISYRPGQLAYGPAASIGHPGNIVLDPDSSLSAILHEYGHFLDDRALDYPSQRYYYENPRARIDTERTQYLREIRIARRFGAATARRQLINDYLAERNYLVETYYIVAYGEE
ncbi:hypothetical protein HSX11_00390 [Oxalobacteraceae bacterium]|nr:hypothetical protein [Oxalobacteraceae bacterium]